MRLENDFSVPAAMDEAWNLLLDVPRVAPCMPGTQLVGADGPDRWKALMKVKMGPMNLVFDLNVALSSVDAKSHAVRMDVHGVEQKGRGDARAQILSSLAGEGEATRVRVESDVVLSGRMAQFASGIVEQVGAQMTDQFAANLRAELGSPDAPRPAPAPAPQAQPIAARAPAPVEPVRVDAMVGNAFLRAVKSFFARLLGRGGAR
jgi:carbon monoxide dehydrogenase subunit G